MSLNNNSQSCIDKSCFNTRSAIVSKILLLNFILVDSNKSSKFLPSITFFLYNSANLSTLPFLVSSDF